MRTAPGAHHWRINLVEFLANAGGVGDIIALGDGGSGQSDPAIVPHNLVIDRWYIHGDPGSPQKRGIALNSAATTITGSYIAEIKSDWQDSQAIGAWNGPGPFTITNNYLEAAGENVMFGGADPAIPNLVPSDITITRRSSSRCCGHPGLAVRAVRLQHHGQRPALGRLPSCRLRAQHDYRQLRSARRAGHDR